MYKSNNESAIRDYITNLDKNIDLMMINEYFDESLVLLKRLMDWSIEGNEFTKQYYTYISLKMESV